MIFHIHRVPDSDNRLITEPADCLVFESFDENLFARSRRWLKPDGKIIICPPLHATLIIRLIIHQTGVVCDPAGSTAMALAVLNTGRTYVGLVIDDEQRAILAARLADHVSMATEYFAAVERLRNGF